MQQETHDFLTLGKLEEARGETPFKSLALLHVSCVLENQAGVIQIPPCHQPGWGWGGQSETLNRLLQYLDSREVCGNESVLTPAIEGKGQTFYIPPPKSAFPFSSSMVSSGAGVCLGRAWESQASHSQVA